MAEHIHVLLNQIMIFTTLLIVGYGAIKCKLINDEDLDHLSKLIVSTILPLMILTVSVSGGSRKDLLGMLPFMVSAYVMVFTMISLGWLTGKLLKLKQPTRNLHTAVIGFGNYGFIGYPLLIAMFPDKAPLAVAAFLIVDSTTLWTIGPTLANPDTNLKGFDFKKIISPTTISALLAIIMILFNLKPNNMVWHTLAGIGNMSKFLALIYIGGVIASKGFKKLLLRPIIFWMIPIKLIIVPICVFFIIKFLNIISSDYIIMLTTLAMMPSMVVICILAKTYGSDDDYASGGLLITTIASMITMPFVMWFVGNF